jgi:hypothetical protein
MKNKDHKLVKTILIIAIIVACCFLFTRCSSVQRQFKSWSSDLSGGLDRTVTLYDYNSNSIASWSGKIDISESENEVYFDLNGKRTIIHGGIVVIQEN